MTAPNGTRGGSPGRSASFFGLGGRQHERMLSFHFPRTSTPRPKQAACAMSGADVRCGGCRCEREGAVDAGEIPDRVSRIRHDIWHQVRSWTVMERGSDVMIRSVLLPGSVWDACTAAGDARRERTETLGPEQCRGRDCAPDVDGKQLAVPRFCPTVSYRLYSLAMLAVSARSLGSCRACGGLGLDEDVGSVCSVQSVFVACRVHARGS